MSAEPQDFKKKEGAEEAAAEGSFPKRGETIEVEEGLRLTLISDVSDNRVLRRTAKVAKKFSGLQGKTEQELQEWSKENPESIISYISSTQEILEVLLGEEGLEKAEDFYAERNDGWCPPDAIMGLYTLLTAGEKGKG